MNLSESAEMYLETLYILSLKHPEVRSVDVANYMDYSKPSVSRGIHLLRESGHVDMADTGVLTLTPKGKKEAKAIYERHVIIADFLMHLGVEERIANMDACRIEHILSEPSFTALKTHFLEDIKKEPKS
ncbi:MAG: metal-dependent transcriptional regulator [Tissierellia bacterium]|nr:metal-dependent transcriptional regulator [Bacillota bacterium]NLK58507.1 metal-dependent transcriptional regulator [Tissierellia bacterium]